MVKRTKSDVYEKLIQEKIKRMPCHIMFFGTILFVIGLLGYLGYDWTIILMILGILVFLKGIIVKLKK